MQQSLSRIRTHLQKNSQYKAYFAELTSKLQQNIKTNKKKKNNVSDLQSVIITKTGGSQKHSEQDRESISKIINKCLRNQINSVQDRQTTAVQLIIKNSQLFWDSFNKHFGEPVNKNTSMLLWVSSFYNTLYIDGFKKVDKLLLKIGEFQQQFQAKLNKSVQMLMCKDLSEQEQSIIKRILQGYYRVSKSNELYLFTLCVLQIRTFSSHLCLNINELGGVFLSLTNLSNHFSSIPSESHLKKLYQTLELIDEQTCKKIRAYVSQSAENKRTFTKVLKEFAKSIGTCYLKQDVARFFIDNLLILGKNRMNIYIGFSIVLMIIFSQQEQEQENQNQDETLITRIRQKCRMISLQKFKQVFNVVYEGVNINKLKNQQIEQEYHPKLDSFGSLQSEEENNDKLIKTAICKLLEQEYEKKEKVLEFQLLKETKQSFQVDNDPHLTLAGMVPVLVHHRKF